ncbi:MAG: amino acid dehydrogenase [Gammaproteobacteria bacterium]|nr:MAG: amino acid dehydrogenase [Gammaproteobacteria bacterium]
MSAREIIVLGAGMVGVSVAWHLVKHGHSVTLIDRHVPGEETSFGNAGVIQGEAVAPYAIPRDPRTLLSIIGNRRTDVRWRPSALLGAAAPLLSYYRHSAATRHAAITREYATLIAACRDAHAMMLDESSSEHLVRRSGYIAFFRHSRAYDEACRQANDVSREFGVGSRLLDRTEISRTIPALHASASRADGGVEIAGGIHWLDAWSVMDPGDLVKRYAATMIALGGNVLRDDILAIESPSATNTHRWRLRGETADHDADDVVIAAGPWSLDLVAPLGIRFPLFPKRGYHRHFEDQATTPLNLPIIDAEAGFVLSPMKRGIRLLTGAELALRDAPPDHGQLRAVEHEARRWYPLGKTIDETPWLGARPCLPDMKPMIGPVAGRRGLWLATGHGHQGFTLGPITGQLLAAQMNGETPRIDLAPFSPARFGNLTNRSP